ncbi:hypothetical protein GCM10023150_12690 [Kangiella taiwanensis]|uniref:Uncharacterized protein n=1 Tax=Kangiella taiwanensis TaxID=1079179 RepID=A0ABP8I0X3_9GAMM
MADGNKLIIMTEVNSEKALTLYTELKLLKLPKPLNLNLSKAKTNNEKRAKGNIYAILFLSFERSFRKIK